MHGLNPETLTLLLVVAGFVAIVARRIQLPYTVGLVAAGIGLSLLPIKTEATLTKTLIYEALLPPLVFEAAFNLDWPALKRDAGLIATLATLGVLLSAGVTMAVLVLALHWDWRPALVFATFIAATDPVSVIATFRETGIKGRMRLLVESESLLNDGTAAAFFGIAVPAVLVGLPAAGTVASTLLWNIGGGIAIGLGVGWATMLVAGKATDHLVEVMLTCIAAFGSFLLAEHFHASGILATVAAAGVARLSLHRGRISESGQESLDAFWEFAAFVANSLVFLLIGLREAEGHLLSTVGLAAMVFVAISFARAVSVYSVGGLFSKSRMKLSWPQAHILALGGIRGALALALALGLPETMPQRDLLVRTAFLVVGMSIVIQGLAVKPLLKRVGAVD